MVFMERDSDINHENQIASGIRLTEQENFLPLAIPVAIGAYEALAALFVVSAGTTVYMANKKATSSSYGSGASDLSSGTSIPWYVSMPGTVVPMDWGLRFAKWWAGSSRGSTTTSQATTGTDATTGSSGGGGSKDPQKPGSTKPSWWKTLGGIFGSILTIIWLVLQAFIQAGVLGVALLSVITVTIVQAIRRRLKDRSSESSDEVSERKSSKNKKRISLGGMSDGGFTSRAARLGLI